MVRVVQNILQRYAVYDDRVLAVKDAKQNLVDQQAKQANNEGRKKEVKD